MAIETSFEQKFGQLADAHLMEKLPALVKYRIGFQVIDKEEDETRAVGVLGFIINTLWAYIPVFFIKGVLKGFDLMWLKQQNLFVPTADNWISVLSEQGGAKLGEGVDVVEQKRTGLVRDPSSILLYDSQAPLQKFSAEWFSKEDLNKMTRMGEAAIKFPELLQLLPKLSKEAQQKFVNTLLSSVDFTNAMLHFYTSDEIQKTASTCLGNLTQRPAEQVSKVLLITDMRQKEAEALTPTEKRALAKNGFFVRDDRENLSTVFSGEIDSSTIQNPASPGIYDVLMADGSFKACAILFPNNNGSDGTGEMHTSRRIGIIDLSAPAQFTTEEIGRVYCRTAKSLTKDQIKGLQGGKEVTVENVMGAANTGYNPSVLLTQSAKNCWLVSLNKKGMALEVSWPRPRGKQDRTIRTESGSQVDLPVEFVSKAGKLGPYQDRFYIPLDSTRLFTFNNEFEGKNKMVFGSPSILRGMALQEAGLKPLRILVNGGIAEVQVDAQTSGPMPKEAALQSLIYEQGIYAGQARQMIEDSARQHDHCGKYLLKYAEGYGNSTTPYIRKQPAQQRTAVVETYAVKGGKPLSGPVGADGAPLIPQDVIRQAEQAAKDGIKEVFDVSVLAGLVDAGNIADLRRDYLKDMVKGMDKVGRMLFIFYWHQAAFEDKYGKEDLIKLEDTLRQVFTSTGDLILFLKEKTSDSGITDGLLGQLSEEIASADTGNTGSGQENT